MRSPTVLLLLALATTFTACGGDSTGPDEDYSGTYSLRTINGQSLPYVVLQVGADRIEYASGGLTLTDNGTTGGSFTVQATTRTTQGGQVSTGTDSNAGTYTRTGTGMVFTSDSDGNVWPGNMSGGRITVSASLYGTPVSLVFQE
jgi:hypothetical protein